MLTGGRYYFREGKNVTLPRSLRKGQYLGPRGAGAAGLLAGKLPGLTFSGPPLLPFSSRSQRPFLGQLFPDPLLRGSPPSVQSLSAPLRRLVVFTALVTTWNYPLACFTALFDSKLHEGQGSCPSCPANVTSGAQAGPGPDQASPSSSVKWMNRKGEGDCHPRDSRTQTGGEETCRREERAALSPRETKEERTRWSSLGKEAVGVLHQPRGTKGGRADGGAGRGRRRPASGPGGHRAQDASSGAGGCEARERRGPAGGQRGRRPASAAVGSTPRAAGPGWGRPGGRAARGLGRLPRPRRGARPHLVNGRPAPGLVDLLELLFHLHDGPGRPPRLLLGPLRRPPLQAASPSQPRAPPRRRSRRYRRPRRRCFFMSTGSRKYAPRCHGPRPPSGRANQRSRMAARTSAGRGLGAVLAGKEPEPRESSCSVRSLLRARLPAWAWRAVT